MVFKVHVLKIVLMLGLGLSSGIGYSTASILRPVKDSKMAKKKHIIDVEVNCNFNQHILSIILDRLESENVCQESSKYCRVMKIYKSQEKREVTELKDCGFTPVSFLFRILCDELQIHALYKQVSRVGQLYNKESCVHGSEIKLIKSRKYMAITRLLAAKMHFQSDFKIFCFFLE